MRFVSNRLVRMGQVNDKERNDFATKGNLMRVVTKHWLRLAGLLGLLVTVSLGCGREPSEQALAKKSSGGLEPVVLMLNWYPEAEHGGFYAAKVHGIYEKHGLDVTIRPGGPNAPVAQELMTGRIQFGVGNADDVLLFRQQDANVIALIAPIMNTPRCILVREDSGITSLDGLKGTILQANQGQPFVDFMRSKGMLEGVEIVPYAGTVAKLVTDKKTAIQAYSFSEPLMAQQQGVPVRTLMLSDIGFNPYASCLMCSEELVTKSPELLKRMVSASREGWQKYLEEPAESNKEILKANEQGMTIEALEFGVEQMRPLCLPDGMPPSDLGRMSIERWQELVDQFAALKLIDPNKVTAKSAFWSEE
jgi:NitT/TauT family transport system substrate-binding protein